MNLSPSNGDDLQRQRRRDRGPVAALLGHRLLAVDRAAATVEVEFRAEPHLFNPMNVMQGGFTVAMLEQALLDAVAALADRPHEAATLEMQCNFLAAIGPGPLRCRAGLVRQGRSTAFVEARLFAGDGELAATATSVVALTAAAGD
ncbi:MAG: PaaI family thioesterase [Alphaproteobacteria bacterium]|jgi:uncharacterized protein (TIGR00369 family)|nr:PaaI family thioesterase [Alphaproteobacteria bacterium]MDP6831163.1 PaaI family thioesterase [Alphaproteobacteria bacterium]MDP6874536.1 PaaI family thioesterase [Alphaproteobacteria bacterium]